MSATATLQNKVTTKLFAGCLITSEIRMHLRLSAGWKNASIEKGPDDLVENHYQGKDYIGLYLDQEMITIAELHALQKQIAQRLHYYCIGLKLHPFHIHIFPQVFIS